MDFDANIKILGKETVADVGILVKAISADRGRTAEGASSRNSVTATPRTSFATLEIR